MKIHCGGIAKTSVGSLNDDINSQTTGNSVNTIQILRMTYAATFPQLVRRRCAVATPAVVRAPLTATIVRRLRIVGGPSLVGPPNAHHLDDDDAQGQADGEQHVRDRRRVPHLEALEEAAED